MNPDQKSLQFKIYFNLAFYERKIISATAFLTDLFYDPTTIHSFKLNEVDKTTS